MNDSVSGDLEYLAALRQPAWVRHSNFALLQGVQDEARRQMFEEFRKMLCEDIYPDEQYATHERAWNADLADMSVLDLTDHRDRVRLRLLIEPRPSAWLRERLAAVLLELKQR